MKILSLVAENYKRLVAVEIRPDGTLVQITGRNAQGKTSVLDSIYEALQHVQIDAPSPIRKGEKKARIKLDLGEITVERKFTEGGTTLVVESDKGARFSSPQTMLDGLLGRLSIDPLEFSRLPPREQFDTLRAIAKIDLNLDELDALNRADFGKRTDINRAIKNLGARLEAMPGALGFLPDEKLDEKLILDKIQRAAEHNATINDVAQRYQTADARAASDQAQIVELEKVIARATADRNALMGRVAIYAADRDMRPPLEQPIDIADARKQLDRVRETNALIDARTTHDAMQAEIDALVKHEQILTEGMAKREQVKREAIASAKMPVDGLGFAEGAITYNGLPFQQASDAERLRVSLAIAMAAQPKLRVIRIRDGSLLDEDGLKLVATMAKDKDFQVWIERVDSTGKIGVVIEDGRVK